MRASTPSSGASLLRTASLLVAVLLVHVAVVTTATECNCPAGQYAAVPCERRVGGGDVQCRNCPPGTYKTDVAPDTTCYPCPLPDGSRCAVTCDRVRGPATVCPPTCQCPPGKRVKVPCVVSAGVDVRCQDCPPGTYRNAFNALDDCLPCPTVAADGVCNRTCDPVHGLSAPCPTTETPTTPSATSAASVVVASSPSARPASASAASSATSSPVSVTPPSTTSKNFSPAILGVISAGVVIACACLVVFLARFAWRRHRCRKMQAFCQQSLQTFLYGDGNAPPIADKNRRVWTLVRGHDEDTLLASWAASCVRCPVHGSQAPRARRPHPLVVGPKHQCSCIVRASALPSRSAAYGVRYVEEMTLLEAMLVARHLDGPGECSLQPWQAIGEVFRDALVTCAVLHEMRQRGDMGPPHSTESPSVEFLLWMATHPRRFSVRELGRGLIVKGYAEAACCLDYTDEMTPTADPEPTENDDRPLLMVEPNPESFPAQPPHHRQVSTAVEEDGNDEPQVQQSPSSLVLSVTQRFAALVLPRRWRASVVGPGTVRACTPRMRWRHRRHGGVGGGRGPAARLVGSGNSSDGSHDDDNDENGSVGGRAHPPVNSNSTAIPWSGPPRRSTGTDVQLPSPAAGHPRRTSTDNIPGRLLPSPGSTATAAPLPLPRPLALQSDPLAIVDGAAGGAAARASAAMAAAYQDQAITGTLLFGADSERPFRSRAAALDRQRRRGSLDGSTSAHGSLDGFCRTPSWSSSCSSSSRADGRPASRPPLAAMGRNPALLMTSGVGGRAGSGDGVRRSAQSDLPWRSPPRNAGLIGAMVPVLTAPPRQPLTDADLLKVAIAQAKNSPAVAAGLLENVDGETPKQVASRVRLQPSSDVRISALSGGNNQRRGGRSRTELPGAMEQYFHGHAGETSTGPYWHSRPSFVSRGAAATDHAQAVSPQFAPSLIPAAAGQSPAWGRAERAEAPRDEVNRDVQACADGGHVGYADRRTAASRSQQQQQQRRRAEEEDLEIEEADWRERQRLAGVGENGLPVNSVWLHARMEGEYDRDREFRQAGE